MTSEKRGRIFSNERTVASAGSGKTYALTSRFIALSTIYPPRSICALTFSRTAAAEFMGFLRVWRELPRVEDVLAAPEDRISEEDIAFIVKNEKIPEALAAHESDPAYGTRAIYLRKQSRRVRLTLFEGGHDILPWAAMEWLSRQAAGKAPDWSAGKPAPETTEQTGLAK